jgi:hypothetical protein
VLSAEQTREVLSRLRPKNLVIRNDVGSDGYRALSAEWSGANVASEDVRQSYRTHG